MATQPWKFLINTFYSQTFNSFKSALSLTQDHLAKLTANEAQPDVLAIKTDYLPVHNGFVTSMNQLDSKLGIYHGKTQGFEEMLEELSKTKINLWRGKVFYIFPEGTTDAHAIFPNDRGPFQKGTYDQRVEAVEALSLTLATYATEADLVTLSTEVHSYYLNLTGARALQQSDEGSVETLRSNLREAHVLMCNGMYKNLGLLMAKYNSNPQRVADYFDLTLLRSTGDQSPLSIEGTINPGQVVNINDLAPDMGGEPNPDTLIRFKNTSTNPVALVFYSASDPSEMPGSGPQFEVNAGETRELSLADLQLETYSKVNIYNNTPLPGSWQVEVDL